MVSHRTGIAEFRLRDTGAGRSSADIESRAFIGDMIRMIRSRSSTSLSIEHPHQLRAFRICRHDAPQVDCRNTADPRFTRTKCYCSLPVRSQREFTSQVPASLDLCRYQIPKRNSFCLPPEAKHVRDGLKRQKILACFLPTPSWITSRLCQPEPDHGLRFHHHNFGLLLCTKNVSIPPRGLCAAVLVSPSSSGPVLGTSLPYPRRCADVKCPKSLSLEFL